MDREAWHAAIHGVAKSLTWLSDWSELNWTRGGTNGFVFVKHLHCKLSFIFIYFLLSPFVSFLFTLWSMEHIHYGFKFQKYKRRECSHFQSWELDNVASSLLSSQFSQFTQTQPADKCKRGRLYSVFQIFLCYHLELSIFLHSKLLCSFFYEHTAFCWVDLSLKSLTNGHLVHFPCFEARHNTATINLIQTPLLACFWVALVYFFPISICSSSHF